MPRNLYIAIEGAIGVGKTTLARLIKGELDAELLLEVFETLSSATFTPTGRDTLSRPRFSSCSVAIVSSIESSNRP